MSQAADEHNNPDRVAQPSLLTAKELSELREVGPKAQKARRQDFKKRVTHKGSTTQPKLPGF
jgi:hypothetical protein